MRHHRAQLSLEQLETRCQPSVVLNPSPGVYACLTGDQPDETVEFRSIIQSAPPKSAIDLEGQIPLTDMVDLTYGVGKNGQPGLAPGFSFFSVGGARVYGTVSGHPLIGRNLQGLSSTASEQFSNIEFHNFAPDGTDVELEYTQDVTFNHCRFLVGGGPVQQPGQLAEGLVIGAVCKLEQDIRIRDCTFLGNEATAPNSIGADISAGRCDFYSVAGYQLREALAVGGLVNVYGGHFEEDWDAIVTGNRGRMYQGVIQGCDFEADVEAIVVTKSTSNVSIEDCNVVGDKHAGSIYPVCGIDVQRGSGSVYMQNDVVGGSFSQSAIHLGGNGPVFCVLVSAGNRGLAGSTLTWDITMDPSLLVRILCT
jgi:hypothetical protein